MSRDRQARDRRRGAMRAAPPNIAVECPGRQVRAGLGERIALRVPGEHGAALAFDDVTVPDRARVATTGMDLRRHPDRHRPASGPTSRGLATSSISTAPGRGRLAAPREQVFVDHRPGTASAKILRRQLRALPDPAPPGASDRRG